MTPRVHSKRHNLMMMGMDDDDDDVDVDKI